MPATMPTREHLLTFIDTEAIIKRLHAFSMGESINGVEVEMTGEQLRAATMLLARAMPEIKQVVQDNNHQFNGDHADVATAAIISEIQRRRTGSDADGARGRPN